MSFCGLRFVVCLVLGLEQMTGICAEQKWGWPAAVNGIVIEIKD